MRFALAICALAATAAVAAGEQPATHLQLLSPEQVTLANGTSGLIAPSLRPLVITPSIDPDCEGTLRNGKVRLSLVIDAQGRPRNIIVEEPVDNALDYLAVRLAGNDLFQPGMVKGAAVAVAATLELKMEGCEVLNADGSGNENISIHLRAILRAKLNIPGHSSRRANLDPLGALTSQLIAGADMSGITAPVPILMPAAYPKACGAHVLNLIPKRSASFLSSSMSTACHKTFALCVLSIRHHRNAHWKRLTSAASNRPQKTACLLLLIFPLRCPSRR